MSANTPKAGLLIIGDEILSGRTQDSNLSFLGRRLHELGITLQQARILPDHEQTIAQNVFEFHKEYEYVFTTGGIGPTHDDITSKSVAEAFSLPLVLDPEAKRLLQKRLPHQNLTPHQLKMAHIPKGACLIHNPVTDAPGFLIYNVYVFAGVPEIMKAMFESIAPSLQGGSPLHGLTLRCYLGESILAPGLEAIQKEHPNVTIGSYPFWGPNIHGASIVLSSRDTDELHKTASEVTTLIHDLGAEALTKN